MCVCVHAFNVGMCVSYHVWKSEDEQLMEIGFLLPPCESRRLARMAWWQGHSARSGLSSRQYDSILLFWLRSHY